MPNHSEVREVEHSADRMFDLVADIESYPAFIPWCKAARIRTRRVEGSREIVVADLVVSFKLFREKLVSHVTLDRSHSRIRVLYLDGPLRKLDCEWRFLAKGEEHCRVEYEVDFEFRSRIMTAFADIFLDFAISSIVSAFENRARRVYGTPRRS